MNNTNKSSPGAATLYALIVLCMLHNATNANATPADGNQEQAVADASTEVGGSTFHRKTCVVAAPFSSIANQTQPSGPEENFLVQLHCVVTITPEEEIQGKTVADPSTEVGGSTHHRKTSVVAAPFSSITSQTQPSGPEEHLPAQLHCIDNITPFSSSTDQPEFSGPEEHLPAQLHCLVIIAAHHHTRDLVLHVRSRKQQRTKREFSGPEEHLPAQLHCLVINTLATLFYTWTRANNNTPSHPLSSTIQTHAAITLPQNHGLSWTTQSTEDHGTSSVIIAEPSQLQTPGPTYHQLRPPESATDTYPTRTASCHNIDIGLRLHLRRVDLLFQTSTTTSV